MPGPHASSRALVLALSLFAAAAAAEAHEGWGIVVQRDGTIYVADIPANVIWRITPNGAVEVAAPGKHSHALVLGADGSVYGTHEHSPGARSGEVWRIAPDGTLATVFHADASFPMNLHPFVMDAAGAFYSLNVYSPSARRVLMRRDADGAIAVHAGANIGGIDGMAVAPDGEIFVSDGTAVRRVSRDGVVSDVATGLTTSAWGEDLMGVTRAADGDLYVADWSGARVLRVRIGSDVTPVAETAWPWSPTGVAFRDREMYVVEHLRMPLVLVGNIGVGPYIRIRRIGPEGAITLATIWGANSAHGGAALVALVALGVGTWRLRRRRKLRASARAAWR